MMYFLKILFLSSDYFFAQLNLFKLKLAQLHVFLKKGWIEKQRTKVKSTSNIDCALDFIWKVYFNLPFLFIY